LIDEVRNVTTYNRQSAEDWCTGHNTLHGLLQLKML